MRSTTLLLLLCGALSSADAPPMANATDKANAADKVETADKAKDAAAQARIPEDEKWQFEPPIGRPDMFEDLERRYGLEMSIAGTATPETPLNAPNGGKAPSEKDAAEAAIAWGGKEIEAIQNYVLASKWDEAMSRCDSAIKTLSKFESHEAVRDLIERIKRFHAQADEAKAYQEAQAKFDALGLKIEGILWSPEGSLAVITGEPRARAINDRVKGCVIINIDTNRVDFLFVNDKNRRRYEFQRYVGEDGKSSARNP
ncbi:MAG: hypothetical protein H0V25_06585 [Solirubrobacterales bacterium]|nr:hypothetical protein [Solirubrobacterales bacterium]